MALQEQGGEEDGDEDEDAEEEDWMTKRVLGS
jgi:hypothetical protein